MPREWERVASNRSLNRPIPAAWQDLSLFTQTPTAESTELPEPLVSEFRIASARTSAPVETRNHVDQWMPAPSFEQLAAEGDVAKPAKIELPGLPPAPEQTVELSAGPLLEPLEPSPTESAPAEPRSPEVIARRVEVESRAAVDPRHHRPEAFAASPSPEPAAEPEPKPSPIWSPPESLHAQLRALSEDRRTAAWADETGRRVRGLGELVDARATPRPEAFGRLWQMVQQAEPLAARIADPALATRLRRASYALRRRLDVWQRVLTMPTASAEARPADLDLGRVQLALADVDAMIGGTDNGRAWREYLLLDALRETTKAEADPDAPVALARRILGRVAMVSLSESQQQFLATEPLNRLAVELRRMAAGPPDRAKLLAAIERYEQSSRPSDGRALADQCLWLGLEDEPRVEDLERHVTMHYRNANLRIQLREEFLNRLMPKRLPEYDRVRDTVLGNPVSGESLTATDVRIRMIPDPSRIRLALEISGQVAALTSSHSGPAMFQNTSESEYTARKPIEVSVAGLTLLPAEVADVSNVTRLHRLRTKFDGVPLLGDVIRNVARGQIDMKRSDVRREVEQKVASRAKRRIDAEADARLGEASQRLRRKILDPMQGMALGPRMIEANTTEDRLTMRLRVASPRQLGAHTPRPKTPSDCLASFQIHQTALNNMVEQLNLDGQAYALPELRAHLARKLNWPELAERKTKNDDVIIAFAESDAIRVSCKEGRITIDLAIAWLERGDLYWEDFRVRVHYRPRVDGLTAELVRDGAVRLPGRRVRASAQIPLRGIFSKVFPKNQTRPLIPDRVRNHPGMKEIAVTQMTIEDGWFALALGPKSRLARAVDRTKK